MIRAILSGRKTQTRRIIKPAVVNIVPFIGADNLPTWEYGLCLTHDRVINKHAKCPYGQPGDQLWVRETFARLGYNKEDKIYYRADGDSQFMGEGRESNGNITRYHTDHWEFNGERKKGGAWKPSIHMPRWASRISLDVKNVRVERVADISEDDAKAEGIFYHSIHPGRSGYTHDRSYSDRFDTARDAFQHLWTMINGRDSWAENPWVWIVDLSQK